MTIFVPPQDIEKKKGIRLSADKAHYLVSVLRCKKGNIVTVIDGKGKAYKALVSVCLREDVSIDITDEVLMDTESSFDLVLCQGILKGEKMDLVIQKTTELGVKEIVPLITERGLVRETRKVNRWKKIAEEAAEQCGRAFIPVVHEPIEFREALSVMRDESKKNGITHTGLPVNPHGFVFWEGGGVSIANAVQNSLPPSTNSPIHLLIGPEGGLSSEEVKLAEESGLVKTTLGRRILRAETAAIAAVTLAQFLFDKGEG